MTTIARQASVFAEIKSEKQREELTTLWKKLANHYTRIRVHAILLSDDNHSIQRIVEIFGVDRDTVRSWIARFDDAGVEGLLEEDKSDGPRKFNEQDETALRELLRQHPSHPARVLSELTEKTGKSISRHTLQRYSRRFKLS